MAEHELITTVPEKRYSIGILFPKENKMQADGNDVDRAVPEDEKKDAEEAETVAFDDSDYVGKDMMGTMSNTLILAFAGGSINTFVYIYSYNYQYYQVLDMYSIGIEIIQGISATLGVILTVPIVSAISAVALKKNI